MKTNYEVKPKKSLRPLKAGLLVLAMVCFGLSTFAQQSKTIRVANDQQLINAAENSAVTSMVFEAGYYASIERYLGPGIKAVKLENGNGGRAADCIYAIQESARCFDPIPPETFVCDSARAMTFDPLACGCCPPNDAGVWSKISGPGTVIFDQPTEDTTEFCVNAPGAYLLRYTWPAPWNSHVQTEYFFYGPFIATLEAADVCGLTTTVHFAYTSSYGDPNTTITWTLNGAPYAGPAPNPLGDTVDFQLTVPWCGPWTLTVVLTPLECPPVTLSETIDFSCQPVADAGDDAEVCEDECYFLIGAHGLNTFSDNFMHTWVQVSGPTVLTFDDDNALETNVCRDTTICSYGEYEIAFEVINGEYFDADTMLLTFYEEPLADAGDDQSICADLCFSLHAVPFAYCSDPIGDERDDYWTLYSAPAGVNLT